MISQIAIALFGLTAVAFSQSASPRLQRAACLFGIAGQPFWLYATASTEQWGMFALCVAYTWIWAQSVWTRWLRPMVKA